MDDLDKSSTYFSLGIFHDSEDASVVSSIMGMAPTDAYNKGDRYYSIHSGKDIVRRQSKWQFKSEVFDTADENFSLCFTELTTLLASKKDALSRLGEQNFYIVVWIWIAGDGGVGIDMDSDLLKALAATPAHMHITYVAT